MFEEYRALVWLSTVQERCRDLTLIQLNQQLQPFFWLQFLSLSPLAGCAVLWSCIQRVSHSKSAYKCQGLRKWDFLGESSEREFAPEPKNRVFCHNSSVLFGKKCVLCLVWMALLSLPLCKSSFCSVFNCIFFENKLLQEKPDCVLHLLAAGGLSVLLYPFPSSTASLWGCSPSLGPDFGRAVTKLLFFACPCVEGALWGIKYVESRIFWAERENPFEEPQARAAVHSDRGGGFIRKTLLQRFLFYSLF